MLDRPGLLEVVLLGCHPLGEEPLLHDALLPEARLDAVIHLVQEPRHTGEDSRSQQLEVVDDVQDVAPEETNFGPHGHRSVNT